MKAVANVQTLQISFLALLVITFLLSSAPFAAALRLLSTNLRLSLPCAALALLPVIRYCLARPRPVLLLNYSCYKPPPHRRCSTQVAESFVRRRAGGFSPAALDFMRGICLKSGLGDQTYAPPFVFDEHGGVPTLESAVQEAEEGIFAAVDNLLAKTQIDPSAIDAVVVTCGSFSPSPSLSSLIVNRYNLRPDVKTYNLSGMGCSSGIAAVDLAARILRGDAQNALVVVTESITLNWYDGEHRPMLVTNCIFRVGCAAAILTTDPSLRRAAKMELLYSLRTHHGADDSAYMAAYQEEDPEGKTGISLTKDLIRVAGVHLKQHIKILAPRVLPLTQLLHYAFAAACGSKPAVPDFTKAFRHMCIHTGGKAVIENVARVLRLSDDVTEPARMSLNRFGNTSSSLVFYELAYFEAKMRARKGDRMWMLAFGTGFKVGSLVWQWIKDCEQEFDNPWMDCIHHYPFKAW